MKKAVLLIAALVVFGSLAFGQATVGAWGRGLFVVKGGGGDKSDILASANASWGGSPRVGMTISGTSDNVGFQADFNVDAGNGGTVGVGDNAKIWVKPIDMVTVQIGQFFDDTLRGNAVFGAWNWLRYDQIDGEDAIFGRVGITNQTNFEIAVAPVEGAYIFAALGNIKGANQKVQAAADMGQYGAGYTIEGIGQIRIQYVGEDNYTSAGHTGYINGAFKLTMIDGLTVDVGAYYWMEDDATPNMFKIALYASYVMDALTIHVYGNVNFMDKEDMDAIGSGLDALGFTIAGGLDYSLEGGIGVNADIRYRNNVNTGINAAYTDYNYPDGVFSGMIAVSKSFSNGLIGVGVEVTTGNVADGATKTDAKAIVFAVPIRLEYSF
jgi:hypothetical protein